MLLQSFKFNSQIVTVIYEMIETRVLFRNTEMMFEKSHFTNAHVPGYLVGSGFSNKIPNNSNKTMSKTKPNE